MLTTKWNQTININRGLCMMHEFGSEKKKVGVGGVKQSKVAKKRGRV